MDDGGRDSAAGAARQGRYGAHCECYKNKLPKFVYIPSVHSDAPQVDCTSRCSASAASHHTSVDVLCQVMFRPKMAQKALGNLPSNSQDGHGLLGELPGTG